MRVMLDPGHGGFDPGAVGPTGLREKDVTLAVCKILASKLVGACEVRLTRAEDRALGENENRDLAGRVALANNWPADVFISIHCNSGPPAAKGMEVFTSPGQGKSDVIAEAIVKAWEAAFPGAVVRKDLSDGDSDKEARYYVLMNTKMPAVLVELAFISNPQEERLLKDPAWQDKAASAIAAGLARALGLKLTSPPSDKVKIVVFGEPIAEGVLINGVSYAPVRALAEALGRRVRWDGNARTVYVE